MKNLQVQVNLNRKLSDTCRQGECGSMLTQHSITMELNSIHKMKTTAYYTSLFLFSIFVCFQYKNLILKLQRKEILVKKKKKELLVCITYLQDWFLHFLQVKIWDFFFSFVCFCLKVSQGMWRWLWLPATLQRSSGLFVPPVPCDWRPVFLFPPSLPCLCLIMRDCVGAFMLLQ